MLHKLAEKLYGKRSTVNYQITMTKQDAHKALLDAADDITKIIFDNSVQDAVVSIDIDIVITPRIGDYNA